MLEIEHTSIDEVEAAGGYEYPTFSRRYVAWTHRARQVLRTNALFMRGRPRFIPRSFRLGDPFHPVGQDRLLLLFLPQQTPLDQVRSSLRTRRGENHAL